MSQKNCKECSGSGIISVRVSERRYVTRDMAVDAGDPQLEGSLYSEEEWDQEPCPLCYDKNEEDEQDLPSQQEMENS